MTLLWKYGDISANGTAQVLLTDFGMVPWQGMAQLWKTCSRACPHAGQAGKGVSPADAGWGFLSRPLRRQTQNMKALSYHLAQASQHGVSHNMCCRRRPLCFHVACFVVGTGTTTAGTLGASNTLPRCVFTVHQPGLPLAWSCVGLTAWPSPFFKPRHSSASGSTDQD